MKLSGKGPKRKVPTKTNDKQTPKTAIPRGSARKKEESGGTTQTTRVHHDPNANSITSTSLPDSHSSNQSSSQSNRQAQQVDKEPDQEPDQQPAQQPDQQPTTKPDQERTKLGSVKQHDQKHPPNPVQPEDLHVSLQQCVLQSTEASVAQPWVDRYEANLRGAQLENYAFPQRLAILGDAHLLYTRASNENVWDIPLGTLQRMAIHDLQRRLVMLVGRIHSTQLADEAKMDEALTLMNKYASAIRDYDLMNEKKALSEETGTKDPFLITSEERTGWLLMKDAYLFTLPQGPGRPPVDISADVEKSIHSSMDWVRDCERNLLPEDSRSQRSTLIGSRMFLDRVGLGIFGGLSIIVPMLIMALKPSLRTSLVVTSVATMIFAVLLAIPAFGRSLNGPTVLASVAAYAAVLVVFVGTTLALPMS